MRSAIAVVFAMTAMHQHVHERTCEQQQIRQNAQFAGDE
jgi:hypothetical protein